jgi:hypothetical protein
LTKCPTLASKVGTNIGDINSTTSKPGMLFREHEQMNMKGSFWEYFVDVNRTIGEYYLAWNKIFGDMEKYFSTCSWMKDIQG